MKRDYIEIHVKKHNKYKTYTFTQVFKVSQPILVN